MKVKLRVTFEGKKEQPYEKVLKLPEKVGFRGNEKIILLELSEVKK